MTETKEQTTAVTLKEKLEAQLRETKSAFKAVDLPIPDIAPDFKFSFLARRIDVITILYSGDAGLPEHLVADILGLKEPEKLAKLREEATKVAEESAQKMDLGDRIAMMKFQRFVAQQVCVAPKIVYGPTTDPESIDLVGTGFVNEFVTALYTYAMKGSPDIPVELENGQEVGLDQVKTFPDVPPLQNDLQNGDAVRSTAEQANANS